MTGYVLAVFLVTMAFTGFLMEQRFDAVGVVPNLASGQTATEQTYFAIDYTLFLNLIAFGLSGFLLYDYRRGLVAPGQHRDPVCGGPRLRDTNRRGLAQRHPRRRDVPLLLDCA